MGVPGYIRARLGLSIPRILSSGWKYFQKDPVGEIKWAFIATKATSKIRQDGYGKKVWVNIVSIIHDFTFYNTIII